VDAVRQGHVASQHQLFDTHQDPHARIHGAEARDVLGSDACPAIQAWAISSAVGALARSTLKRFFFTAKNPPSWAQIRPKTDSATGMFSAR